MESEDLYNKLYGKSPAEFSDILIRFLEDTSDEDIQNYNTYTDMEYFTRIWIMIKDYKLGDLAVKFINKLMMIKNNNKFMVGFANNSENTMYNLKFIKEYDQSLPNIILNTYTTPEKKLLFQAHSKHTGTLGGYKHSKKYMKKYKKRSKRKYHSRNAHK